jgi:hypothetical protein
MFLSRNMEIPQRSVRGEARKREMEGSAEGLEFRHRRR